MVSFVKSASLPHGEVLVVVVVVVGGASVRQRQTRFVYCTAGQWCVLSLLKLSKSSIVPFDSYSRFSDATTVLDSGGDGASTPGPVAA
jgi:hypothetical protein